MFKVGDKVKCIKPPNWFQNGLKLDKIYSVKDVGEHAGFQYVRLVEDPNNLEWNFTRFELYEEDDFSNLDLTLDI